MTQFSGGQWSVNANVWTALNSIGGHPNGITTSQGRTSVEQWAVRRWISPVSGTLSISGAIADQDVAGGNGVIAHIFVDGVQVFTHTVNNGENSDFNYRVTVTVAG